MNNEKPISDHPKRKQPKIHNVKATERQKKFVEQLAVVGGDVPKAEIIRNVGYSETMATTPSRVTESRGVQILLEKAESIGLTDEVCLKRINEAVQGKNLDRALQTIFNWYRLKYPAERAQINTQTNIQVNMDKVANDEEMRAWAVSEVKQMLKDGKITLEELQT